MLVIRDAQLKLLGAVSTADFATRMVEFLMQEYPGHATALGLDGMRALVTAGMASAAARSIRSSGAIAVWIDLELVFGSDLVRSPDRKWANRILQHPTLPDHVKLEIVRERLTARTAGRPVMTAAIQA